jgi:competence protein ComEC
VEGLLRRPSLILLGSVWAGIAIACRLDFHPGYLIAAIGCVVAGLLASKCSAARLLLLAAGFLILGVLVSPEADWNRLEVPPEVVAGGTFPVVLRVSAPPILAECTENVKARVEGVVVGFPALEGQRVYLRGLDRLAWPGGVELTVIGEFRVPRRRLNPYASDRLERCLRAGVVGDVYVESIRACGDGASSQIAGVRRRLEELIARSAGPEAAGMLEALILGKRSGIDPDLASLMIKAGTYHVLAISGLHVGIVVLIVAAFLSFLRLGRRTRILVTIVCVLCFVVFTGARPSAQRAWTFFLLLGVCRLLQCKIDYPNCVCATGVILLLTSPGLAWDLGFRLSLAAVFGITLLVPQFSVRAGRRRSLGRRVGEYLLTGMIASFSAQVFTLPILLYHFGRVSLIGPIANLAALPLVTLIVAAAIEAAITLPIWGLLAQVFMQGGSALVGVLAWSLRMLTHWIDPLVFAGRPGMARIVIYAAGVGFLTLVRPCMTWKARLPLLILLCAFLIVPFPRRADGRLRATFLYVGDGDACLIEMPNGRNVLIDAGAGGETFDAGRIHLLPFLAIKGHKRIDTVILTHSHNDHYGGIVSLLGSVDIGEILVGTTEGESGYQRLIEMARGRGDVLLEVLHPPGVGFQSDDPNDWSVVCRLIYEEVAVLFTGDATPGVQRRLAGAGVDLTCDVLKVPHHGAPDGVDMRFAGALGAKYSVISVGQRFASHPSPKTIALLEQYGMTTFTTDTHGAVTLTTDGHRLLVTSCSGEAPMAASLP